MESSQLEAYCARTIEHLRTENKRLLEENKRFQEEIKRYHDMFIVSQKQIDQLTVQVDKLQLVISSTEAERNTSSGKPKYVDTATQQKLNKLGVSRAIHVDTDNIVKPPKRVNAFTQTKKIELPKPAPKPTPRPKKEKKDVKPSQPKQQHPNAKPKKVQPTPPSQNTGFTVLNQQADPFAGSTPAPVLQDVQVQSLHEEKQE